jgi:hypothetical protein
VPLEAGTIDSGVVAVKTIKHNCHLSEGGTKGLTAVIVEPRTNNLLETIIHYLHRLPSDTQFQVYHGTKNEECLLDSEELRPLIKSGKVKLIQLGVDNLTILGYCKLLCSEEFWQSIPTEKILIFQTDSITCSKSSQDFDSFLEYDFIGAPVPDFINAMIRFLFLCKGWMVSNDFYNGGLSLRSKSKCLAILKHFPWDEKTSEDLWFCAFMKRVGGKLVDRKTSRRFSYEAEYELEMPPWGLHKPRRNKENLECLCPEYKKIPFVPAHTDRRTLYIL